jgi:hypothetical protein
MGLRFRKSIKIAPGIRLNVGKKSIGVSVGGRHGGISVNSRTGARARASLPGTGLSYTTSLNSKRPSERYRTSCANEKESSLERAEIAPVPKPQKASPEEIAMERAEKRRKRAENTPRQPENAATVKSQAKVADSVFIAIALVLALVFRNFVVWGGAVLFSALCAWDFWKAFHRTDEVIAANIESNRKLDIEAGIVPSSEN